MIVRGKAAKPTYVFIDDKEITFRDASHIWGKETGETVKMVREELGERYEGEIRVLSISIAGEHLVKYAVACGDATSCPGRSGGGTVMGSKNLKAIAVRGTGEIQVHDPRGLLESSYKCGQEIPCRRADSQDMAGARVHHQPGNHRPLAASRDPAGGEPGCRRLSSPEECGLSQLLWLPATTGSRLKRANTPG